ncbi:MAG: pyruvate dehydrogenase (acetyl-transferring) E1 component subunit alpha [Chloroflexi bacterium 44-23]|nr:MAG: pyruvate dehydrogenase (acetyl-transferring) E1 component subunit alpha [Chloroflexi bacterium 44-23]
MEKSEYLDLYRQMVEIRILEENAMELYQKGKIGGFLHLYIGQEAVSTGLISARRPEDNVITAYRDHGVAINCGLSANEIMAELLGKATGCSGGRGGSMHMADVTKNFWGGHAVVGAHLPLAVGMALGDQLQKKSGITICMFGDGATNIGYFHEALNLSKVWELPVLWVCENNHYGMGTAVDRASAVPEIRQKAAAYNMPSDSVDGMDVIKVREISERMIAEVRAGSGPQFLEILTYRFEGHSMGDPERYRKKDEVRKWKESDPIGIYHKYLVSEKIAKESELSKVEAACEQIIAEAVQFAESSPEPAPDTLFDNIYADKN